MESVTLIVLKVLAMITISFLIGVGMGAVLQKEKDYLGRLNDDE